MIKFQIDQRISTHEILQNPIFSEDNVKKNKIFLMKLVFLLLFYIISKFKRCKIT